MVAAIALGTPIARGGFGLVTKVAINGIELAAKSPRVVHGHVSNSLTEIFFSEEQALKDVHHPHVAQLLGSIYGKVTGVVEKVLHLIFPLYACDLSAVKAGVKQLSFMEFVQVAIHLAEGFSHMHDRGYVHLDIKPTNLLLTLPPTKGIVGDLGLARHVDSLGHARFAHAPCGTPPYIAPELGSKENQKIPAYSPASDVWAFGLSLFEVLTWAPSTKSVQVIVKLVEQYHCNTTCPDIRYGTCCLCGSLKKHVLMSVLIREPILGRGPSYWAGTMGQDYY